MRKKKWVLTYLPALALGLLLLLVPLLRDVHLESALLASVIICFWGGWKACNKSQPNDFKTLLSGLIVLFLIFLPLFIHGFISDCLTREGVLLWALLPVPSLLFGVAVGRFYRLVKVPGSRIVTLATLLLVAFGIWVIEFFTLPQVYYFNHVWGYWPGPIYDEEIRITAALFWFRLSTLLWVLLLWALPAITKTVSAKISTLLAAFAVLTLLLFQPDLGISTPRSALKSQLSNHLETTHFRLYYDAKFYSTDEIEYWANMHEFYFEQIVNQLDIKWPQDRMIESYLYNHAWHKKALVGAKFTSYVPVWLEQDQLHIAKEHLEGVLKHELVHVLSKQFGNTLFNASWSIGLIEGVAEAIAGDASDVSTLDQIIAAEQPLPTSKQMQSALSLTGFYGSASAISYTTAGSFVKYLLQNYPVKQFKEAYPRSDFEAAYALPFDTLVQRWKAQLPINEVDSVDREVSQSVFSQQSIFQVNCPRKTHPILAGFDEFQYHTANNAPQNALQVVEALFNAFPKVVPVKQLWARTTLSAGDPQNLIAAVSKSDSLPAFHLYKADALFISNGFEEAANYLKEMERDFFDENDPMLMQSLFVRSDSLSWAIFFNARYFDNTTSRDVFTTLPIPLQWLLVDRAVSNWDKATLVAYSHALVEQELDPNWFDTQERLTYLLVYYKEAELARLWIEQMKRLNLRERYTERIYALEEWAAFNDVHN